MEELYLEELKEECIGYGGKTPHKMIEHLQTENKQSYQQRQGTAKERCIYHLEAATSPISIFQTN